MISERLAWLKSSSLVRNVTVLASGTVAAQLILWLSTPLLTRLFTPEDFGVLGLFVTVAGLLAVFATFRYEQAIILERNRETANQVFGLCLSICAAFALIWLVAAAFQFGIAGVELTLLGANQYLLFAPLLALAMGLRASGNMQLINAQRVKLVAASDVAQTGTSVALQLALGLSGVGATGLIIGNVAGVFAAVLLLTVFVVKSGTYGQLKGLDYRQIRSLARRHYRFPLFTMPTGLLERFSKEFPVILLAVLFSPLEAGYYWLTFRLLINPVRTLTSRTRKAYYLRASQLNHEGKSIAPLFFKSTGLLTAALVLPMAILAFAGPELFEFVLGAQWTRAGEYARWLSLIPIAALARIPSIELAPIYNQQSQVLMWQIVQTSVRATALTIGAVYGDDVIAVAFFSVATASSNFLFVAYFWRLTVRRAALLDMPSLSKGTTMAPSQNWTK